MSDLVPQPWQPASSDREATLYLVEHAAAHLRSMEDRAVLIEACTRELLVRTQAERQRIQQELYDLQAQMDEWHQRALTAEADAIRIEQLMRQENQRRKEIEVVAFKIAQRAETAERRCQELEADLESAARRMRMAAGFESPQLTVQPGERLLRLPAV